MSKQTAEINIEKLLHPEAGVLNKSEESVTAVILDADLDVIELSFDYSQSVTIKTDGLQYICLSYENLKQLKKLLDESEMYFEEKFKNQ
tara:strand:+ start:2988 stop:3254 length:267 start_codon:yes stop_codon:yes gene_type:complete